MRHLNKFNRLKRCSSHRKALLRNLSISLVIKKRIKTTLSKAKALRPFVEKLITIAKKNTVSAHRHIASKTYHNREIDFILFKELGFKFKDRDGGYTRILKLPPRKGDDAKMALIEFV